MRAVLTALKPMPQPLTPALSPLWRGEGADAPLRRMAANQNMTERVTSALDLVGRLA
jgi:hypothetical protein